MNRKQLISRIASTMREGNIRKAVSSPRHVFHISDDEGNHKDFVVKQTDRNVLYTTEDIGLMLDACLYVIEDALKHGEPITIHGFGTLGLHHRAARTAKNPLNGEMVDVAARYVPKFVFGNTLRMAARVYEMSLDDAPPSLPPPRYDDEWDETEDGE